MANPLSRATVNHIRAGLGIAYVSRVQQDLVLTLQMLLQAGHQLNEVAGTETIIKLVDQDAVPGVATGAGRSRQREQIGAAGHPGRRAALDCRGADLLVAEPAEQLAKAGDLLLVDAVERFRRYV